ncbi:hypothetical protein Q9247_09760 [Halomonas meridiana]|uniref:hypothetical protein n=1 Tax=Vreelandella aquamarina TaxID=77097 RepID=UPI00273C2B20|nr:hypothetical protein [Halomonas meridiana]MDP4557968.1 hypothetical protein [Halomonas meridiana]
MLHADTIHGWLEGFGMTAAWLQAWGSIGALGIALALAFYNHNQERKREKARQVAYMEAIAAINKEAIEAVSWVISDMNSNALIHHGITTSELNRCIQALATITLESLPNAKAYMAIHQLRKELQGIYYVASSEHDYDLGIPPDTLDEISEAEKRLKAADKDFSKALRLAK